MVTRFSTTLLVALALFLYFHPLQIRAQVPSEEGQVCLGCHGNSDFQAAFEDGSAFPLYVDNAAFRHSVHGSMDCSSCHLTFSTDNHPQRSFKNLRTFKAESAGACAMCHFFEEGIHAAMLKEVKTLVCSDCHTAHKVEKPDETKACLGCHTHGLTLSFVDGGSASLTVDTVSLKESVHGSLRCSDCHFGFSSDNHPQRQFKSQRDLTITSADACRRCHFDKYTRSLESIHYSLLSHGNTAAPSCVDCHGSHTIFSGRKEKLRSAQRCRQCHPDIYETYSHSVHGEALTTENNMDVPICSDCHTAHNIEDPRTTNFRNKTPEVCGNCHANEERMAKYGLSTAVIDSYLEDFHGVTAMFYKKEGEADRRIAVCTDCHGIHDITRAKAPDSTVLKDKLLDRCQKCHPDASENFPDAWISHYEPSLTRAPLVYLVNLGYGVLIPFMIIGLLLQILLHIWRYAVNR